METDADREIDGQQDRRQDEPTGALPDGADGPDAADELTAADGDAVVVAHADAAADAADLDVDAAADLDVDAAAELDVDAEVPDEDARPSFPVAYARGVNPGKWARIWSDRRPDTALALVRTDLDDQRTALFDGRAEVGFARLPIDRDGLHAIQLYEELPVVVFSIEHRLMKQDDVSVADLADEQLIMPPLVLGWDERAAELGFADPATPLASDAEAAIELAASEVGVVVVPQSVARLHHRKDVEYRPITDLPGVPIVLVWPVGRESAEIDDFIGIVRGRTANSSRRGSATEAADAEAAAAAPVVQQPQQRKKAKPKQGTAKGTPAGTSRGSQLAARKANGRTDKAKAKAKRKRH